MSNQFFSNLGVSSLGWEPDEDTQVIDVLLEAGIQFIDLVPTKYLSWDCDSITDTTTRIRKKWLESGIRIRAVQSLFYGAGPMNILSREDWPAILMHFGKVFSVTKGLGGDRVVFGSPANRQKGGLTPSDANQLAIEFFEILAGRASEHECLVLFEPNPEAYNCDFVNTTFESFGIVEAVNHSNLRTQLDLGTVYYNEENLDSILHSGINNIGYVHLATKQLMPLHEAPNPYIERFLGYPRPGLDTSVEMLAGPLGSNALKIQKSINWLSEIVSRSKI
jgi:sugar phosphate isomerase/epimerase